MRVVRRIFRMMGSEHQTLYASEANLREGGYPYTGRREVLARQMYPRTTSQKTCTSLTLVTRSWRWWTRARCLLPVAAGLDSNKGYGIWWFNRRRTKAHPGFGGGI